MKIRLIDNITRTSIEIDPSDDRREQFYPLIAVTISKLGICGESEPSVITTYNGQLKAEQAKDHGAALMFAGWVCKELENLRGRQMKALYSLIGQKVEIDRVHYGTAIYPVIEEPIRKVATH